MDILHRKSAFLLQRANKFTLLQLAPPGAPPGAPRLASKKACLCESKAGRLEDALMVRS